MANVTVAQPVESHGLAGSGPASATAEGLSIREFVVLIELFTSIVEEHLKGPVPQPEGLHHFPGHVTETHLRWLMVMNLCAAPEVLRRGIQERSPDDESLIVLMRYLRHLGRPVDDDRFDWVLSYVFRRRLERGAAEGLMSIGAQIVEMFPDFPQPPLSSNAKDIVRKITLALEEIHAFSSFAALSTSGLIARGRELKEQFLEERYLPAVLAAVVNYNLVLGKAFRRLFNCAALQSRELAKRLAQADYRSNVEHMSRLKSAAAEEQAPAETGADHVVRGPLQDPFKELGLDDTRELQKLRFAQRSLVAYCEIPENLVDNIVRLQKLELALADWETRALSTDYPSDDRSFRAEFARSLARAAAFLFRIEEERNQLERLSSSEFLWKPHYDALIWLHARGKEYAGEMGIFAEEAAKRGLLEKQQQILKSAARLAEAVGKVARHLTETQ